MFDKLKQIMQLKSQMAEIKKRLDTMVVKVKTPKQYVEVTISGSQEIKELTILTDLSSCSKEELATDLKDGINRAIKESQAMAAKVTMDFTGLNV